MLGTADYSIKMEISEVLTIALVGLLTVMAILALIAVCIIVISKIIRLIESKAGKKKESKLPESGTPQADVKQGTPLPDSMSIGSLELVGTDEATAAVIMAIVSDKSGIPLNRLVFKSIRLMED
ncbi:MAG: OadG family protein [Acutalibacteraceae bacterium]